MGLLGDYVYGREEDYIILYRNSAGKEHSINKPAFDKLHAEILFKRDFYPGCEIIKIQTFDEWTKEVVEDIAKDMMEHIKNFRDLVDSR
ncbi:MAG: hypothetical protein NTZ83_02110 [Candidatus Pacearchaeota archaeon]|nr:hypothetical protein [Candidatus Pacearchaeota archaeon]